MTIETDKSLYLAWDADIQKLILDEIVSRLQKYQRLQWQTAAARHGYESG